MKICGGMIISILNKSSNTLKSITNLNKMYLKIIKKVSLVKIILKN